MNISRIPLAFKALRELGPRQTGLFALYRLGLWSGYFRRQTADREPSGRESDPPPAACRPLLDLPAPEAVLAIIGEEGLSRLREEADEITAGRIRLFGGDPRPLDLSLPENLPHWTAYETGAASIAGLQPPDSPPDVKFIWEPARFSWAFTLGRTYHLTGDERYPAAFWRYFEIFSAANPPYRGPNWISAQEAALRILAFTFAAQVFAPSGHTTAERQARLAQSVAEHAERIPPTLVYARAQNNNHLLSEAAGLITAALVLPEHPEAPRWAQLGWQWFNRGLQTQIASDGAYMQHSTNYHRLMLQLALWIKRISESASQRVSESASQRVSGSASQRSAVGGPLSNSDAPSATRHPPLAICHLQSATRWLLALVDRESGRVPNLGPNDGAYILPLTVLPFHDYRPVAQAAVRTFLGGDAFGRGPWDEMGLWIGESANGAPAALHAPHATLRAAHSWAYLRVARFRDRPGHADQLHLDLWWRGVNIAQDAGTYLYNAPPPWDNALTRTAVHNTVTVDGRGQMTRAGRFLYLDWAQAEVTARERAPDGSWERVTARHDGYRSLGVIHLRTVTAFADDRWQVEDHLIPTRPRQRTPHAVRLHWLLPDLEWTADSGPRAADEETVFQLSLQAPRGVVKMAIRIPLSVRSPKISIARAGEQLIGDEAVPPTRGWVSPTYGVKIPALSLAVTVTGGLPLTLVTAFTFPA